ncbi:14810_t:CDS:1, partial [Acaulospora morrowiae]
MGYAFFCRAKPLTWHRRYFTLINQFTITSNLPSPIQNSTKPIANTTAVTSKIEPISLEDKVIDEFLDE